MQPNVRVNQNGAPPPYHVPTTAQALAASAAAIGGTLTAIGATTLSAFLCPFWLTPFMAMGAMAGTVGLVMGTLDGTISQRTINAIPRGLAGLLTNGKVQVALATVTTVAVTGCALQGFYVPAVLTIGVALGGWYYHRAIRRGDGN